MEKTAEAVRKVRENGNTESIGSVPSEMTQVRADPALGRNTESLTQEWLSPSWPCCSVLNFKGALSREQGDTSNPPARQPWPQDITSPPVQQQLRQEGDGGCRQHQNDSQCWELDMCTQILCWKQSTFCTRITNPTLFLHT